MHLAAVVGHIDLNTALFLTKLHHRAHVIVGDENRHGVNGLADFSNLINGRQFTRVFHPNDFAVCHQHFVHNGRGRRDEVHVVFALKTLLHNVHVQ